MALEADFLTMASTTVTVTPLSTHNAWGAPVYSTASSTYPARVEYGPRLVVSAQGPQEVASATVYVLSSSASIGVQDRVTLPNDSAARLLRVDILNDDEGQHHLELLYG